MRVLGIETSCDETAAAIVDDARQVLAEIVYSQLAEHAIYGGVVPELAARAHVSRLDRLLARVLREAGLRLDELDAVAVTAGPGLAGGLLVGVVTAQALAAVHGLPLIAVNHLEAHALTARLTHDLPFPYLLLLVSGGHCQLLLVEDVGRYRRLGATIDDAVGEAFDKVAKMLGLGYPGGPAVERAARRGDPSRFPLPRPLVGRPGCDFSFSGLKTAVRHTILRLGEERLDGQTIADLCASFEAAVCDILVDRTRNALTELRAASGRTPPLVVAGGVAANAAVRRALVELVEGEPGAGLVLPPAHLCTDNAVMVAWAGVERLTRGLEDAAELRVHTRWPLDAEL
jgi:N6-L-threonylcarbamoyladenine synthase